MKIFKILQIFKINFMNITLASATGVGFLCSYFLQLTMENAEQYLAVAAVLLLDGFFGVIAGTKREGFKTYKIYSNLGNNTYCYFNDRKRIYWYRVVK